VSRVALLSSHILAMVTMAPAMAMAMAGCDSKTRFTTTMEVIQAEPFTDASGKVETVSLELRYADCPGNARRILRADRAFAGCAAGKLAAGAKLKADLVSTWQSDRGAYRSDVVRLGDCPLEQDPKDEANYEMVQTCTDVVATGAVVGVRCDRTRSAALVGKCPWLRRR
jgi:hypothetical protein